MLNISLLDKLKQLGYIERIFFNGEVCQEFIYCKREYNSVSTDSRNFNDGEIFLALDGEKFRGIDFLEDVLEAKADLVVFNADDLLVDRIVFLSKKYSFCTFVSTKNTVFFLQQMAYLYAQEWLNLGKEQKKENVHKNKRIIGITGTNGKTTSKEMLFHFLNSVFPGKVLATEKNYNNHLGVPKTLLSLRSEHDYAIIEMGSNHPGEIKKLVEISNPQVGIITNIGDGHLEFFIDREGVFQEKRILFDAVMSDTAYKRIFVLNYGDPFLRSLVENRAEDISSRIVAFQVFSEGSEKQERADIPTNIDIVRCFYCEKGSESSIVVKGNNSPGGEGGKDFLLKNSNIVGIHNFTNLAAAFLLAKALIETDIVFHKIKQTVERMREAANTFISLNNRSLWVNMDFSDDEKSVASKFFYLDAYNANPSSMSAALIAIVSHLSEKKVDPKNQFYVLGDMNELGESTFLRHQEIGKLISELGIMGVAFIGRFSSYYLQGYRDHHDGCFVCVDKEEFKKKYWRAIIGRYQYFFIKGSRSLQLETLLDIPELSLCQM
ncbi:MAG: UDP-N-acetylmuramoyl-tripeptide--D-alanyl-D-alanine ligase [Oligoflexia bacterium]|nr:UDP-N-acetylmuramoyl-tripeptide--D-alanyl-D-alanine ligase [Oligoflexia bacterium]